MKGDMIMSFGQRVKEFFSGLGEAVMCAVDSEYLEQQAEGDCKRLEQDVLNEVMEDNRVLMRVRDVLREKGYEDATYAIGPFDVRYIRTGKVHPQLRRPAHEILPPAGEPV